MITEVLDIPTDKEVVWSPSAGSQTLFLSSGVHQTIYSGSRGPGKTDAMLMDFVREVGKGHGSNWRGILFRRTYKELSDVVAKSRKWFTEGLVGSRFLFAATDFKWVWPTGEELLFRHIFRESDYYNYHGHEYPWIGWEELTTWPDATCFDAMKSCNRCGKPDVPLRIRATTNPYGVGHNWVKQRFVDPAKPGKIFIDQGLKTARVFGKMNENPYLSPEYFNLMDNIEDVAKRAAWVEGDWDIIAGGMFSDIWDSTIHRIKPFRIPSEWHVNRAFDWGSSKPCATIWVAESDGGEVDIGGGDTFQTVRGDLFVICEYYSWNGSINTGTRQTAREIARTIADYEKTDEGSEYVNYLEVKAGPADTAIYNEESGHCIADDMADEGITWTRADKRPGSRKLGWEAIRGLLKNAVERHTNAEADRKQGLYIFDNCTHLLRTLPPATRDEKDMDDIPTECEDHLLDALRYRCRRSFKVGFIAG